MGVYFRLHPATGGVPACRGSGEIDDSEREGISVFPEEDGLYRYMAARDVADAKLLLLEGEATGDTDFDADEGAVLTRLRESSTSATLTSTDRVTVAGRRRRSRAAGTPRVDSGWRRRRSGTSRRSTGSAPCARRPRRSTSAERRRRRASRRRIGGFHS